MHRAAHREADESLGGALPIYIRATGTHFGPDERAYTHRKLDQKLGKFASSIERVSIRIDDVNGPRGGIDQKCRMKVVLIGQPSVIVNTQQAEAHEAVDAAITGVEKTVRRGVKRRRTHR
ncbi:MAG: HPF/RaiA family ribosome-associated protein [Phycisphaerales bacterium]|nr:HPF/RaiA family ribosome-associated protein [Phycisphaerales bacterium]MCI0630251.1 HPF/RaiA family ribosome-associated protein [Phycisphaerales bacterium]MCI0675342.1 HPF/RaiA family ribosome-associated protein [Phycisphaerales bacterium]